jgi:hypothetical protein
MIATKTVQGVAPPAQVNTRPNGRYSVLAPEAPIGAILRVTTRGGSTRFVQRVSELMFLDVAGQLVTFVDWEFATRLEAQAFLREQRIEAYADAVDIAGAPAFAATVRGLPRLERDSIICETADVLRERGKDGRASQVLEYRFEDV